MKAIIALKGLADSGKTATLKKVYEHLKVAYPNAPIRHELAHQDIRAVMEIKGRLLGIESQGDPSSRIFTSISLFVQEECDIIICATRTRRATVRAVLDLSPQYDIKWIDKPRESDATRYEQANTAFALDIMKQVEILLNA
jgi:hypothetical protein